MICTSIKSTDPGISKSFKVIEICTNRKPKYDFLLGFHCNYVFVFYYLNYSDLLIENVRL